ncbi:FAD-dependent monooxygenase [Pseudonocardia aurantiaca]|uniref:FAD-dependent monooxygenase n=1 Tax=Pseudonocardia aurantiaca TaxID=75290 RepID=A0ABW4FLQ2_9PSEU
MKPTVLISGASVAGPALAYWLHRHGFRAVVVERAGAVRGGGYPIDVRGVALDVADRMGMLPRLRGAHVGTRRVTFVNANGRVTGQIAPDGFTGSPEGRDLELPRGDLTRALYEATRDDVEYVFDDSITAIDEHQDGVHVTFRRGAPRTVDLVVGADGLHSNVRALAFGPERAYRHDLGFRFAAFTMDDGLGLDREALFHNIPGRLAGWYAVHGQDLSTAFLAFADDGEADVDPHDLDQQRRRVTNAFSGAGWEVPRILAALRTAEDLFSDSVSQIRMPRWTSGRVALVGDAAYAPSFLSGQGTSIALVGAYLLAGELATARGDHRLAFGAYERQLRPFVERNQRLAKSGTFALVPATRTQIWLRDRLLGALTRLGPLARRLNGGVNQAARALELRDYESLPDKDDATASG